MKVENADIKDRVFKTTRDLLKRYGLKGWNMDILARETGLAKNTLYKIIGTKELLLEQVILTKIREDIALIEEAMSEDDDYEGAVERMTRRFAALVKDDFETMIPGIYLEYPSIEKRVRSSHKDIYASIEAFIRLGMEKGIIRNDVDPEFIIDLVEGITLHYYRTGLTGERFEKAFRDAVDCLVNGLGQKQGKA